MDIAKAKALIEDEFQQIGRNEPTSGLYEPIRYLMAKDKERTFSMLTLHGFGLYADDLERCVKLAAGLQIFEGFMQMTEDLLDGRGRFGESAPVHEKWNRNTVILSGDVMLIHSYQMLCESGMYDGEVLKMFTEACRKALEEKAVEKLAPAGSQGSLHGSTLPGRAQYAGLCLQLGGQLAGANEKGQIALRQFGESLWGALYRENGTDERGLEKVVGLIDNLPVGDENKVPFKRFISNIHQP